MEDKMDKSKEDIEALKANWLRDPCWDIEQSEGFEAYHDELLAYRKKKEAEWEQARTKHRAELAMKVCPIFHAGDENIRSYCVVDACAWWNETEECCAVRAMNRRA